jgi:aromatic ring hydroxylase
MRTGQQFLESLRDGRAVYLDGERVKDVTTHPGFAEPIRQIAVMYDLAREAWDPATATYVDPATGERPQQCGSSRAHRRTWRCAVTCIAPPTIARGPRR